MEIRSNLRRWASYRQTVRELNALNTRQLTDLGIDRTEIKLIARNHASLL
jgi:uncharacterized protein YjiS (DUF1127 family)